VVALRDPWDRVTDHAPNHNDVEAQLGRVVMSCVVTGSRGSYAGGMVGAALSRRAGLGSAAAALVFALMAGTGCGGPAGQSPGQGQQRTQAAAVMPEPPGASLPRVRGGLPWPVTLRTAAGRYVIARSGAMRRLGPAGLERARASHPAGFVWVNRRSGTWAIMRDGHLVIMRNRAVIWQSAARYKVQDAADMAEILPGRPGIAFKVHLRGPLLIARGAAPSTR